MISWSLIVAKKSMKKISFISLYLLWWRILPQTCSLKFICTLCCSACTNIRRQNVGLIREPPQWAQSYFLSRVQAICPLPFHLCPISSPIKPFLARGIIYASLTQWKTIELYRTLQTATRQLTYVIYHRLRSRPVSLLCSSMTHKTPQNFMCMWLVFFF